MTYPVDHSIEKEQISKDTASKAIDTAREKVIKGEVRSQPAGEIRELSIERQTVSQNAIDISTDKVKRGDVKNTPIDKVQEKSLNPKENIVSGPGKEIFKENINSNAKDSTVKINEIPYHNQKEGCPKAGEIPTRTQISGSYDAASDSGEYACSMACARMTVEYIQKNDPGQSLISADGFAIERYDPGKGSSPDAILNILNSAGINSWQGEGNSINDLKKSVKNGDCVIAAVGAGDWYGNQQEGLHNIVVKGVKETPEQTMFIVNDPGQESGENLVVTQDYFVKAWDSSHNHMTLAFRK